MCSDRTSSRHSHTHTQTHIDTQSERLLTELANLLAANPVQQCCHFHHSVVILLFHAAYKDGVAKAPKFDLFESPALDSYSQNSGLPDLSIVYGKGSGHVSVT